MVFPDGQKHKRYTQKLVMCLIIIILKSLQVSR